MIGAPHTDGPEPLRTDRLPPSSSWAAAPANGTNTLPYERSRLMPECASPSSAHSHCDSHKPPARTGASRRPRAAWRKPPARTKASRGQRPDAKLRLTPRRENREATYRPPPSSAHPRLRRRRRSFRAIWSAAARSWRTSDDAEQAQAPAAERDSANRGGSSLQGRRLQAYRPARDRGPRRRRGPGGAPPARGHASSPTRPIRPRLCKGRQPCHASLEATSQARNSSQ